MSMPKKRKSDVHIDVCARDNADHQLKKEKPWFEKVDDTTNGRSNRVPQKESHASSNENRRGSFLKGIIKKVTSTSNLIGSNKTSSTAKLESFANDTQLSINSESSVTSAESTTNPIVPNIAKNAGLRTFVNRDSITPIPNPDHELMLPKEEAAIKTEDSISMSSLMSVESNNIVDDHATSTIPTSVFCTPSRLPFQRGAFRTSTRSVPEGDEKPSALFDSLCNSTVRPSKPNGSLMRRSMRMSMQKRNINSKSMEDVPEEEALTVSNSSMLRNETIDEGDEDKLRGQDFDMHESIDHDTPVEGTHSMSRLLTASEPRLSCGTSSIGRKSSILRKLFTGKGESKERRMSDMFTSSGLQQEDIATSSSHGRRSSIVSFTSDLSFTGGMGSAVNANASVTSLASNDSVQKTKLKKKAPSTSNLSQRISSVFRKSSSSAMKDDQHGGPSSHSSRRNTLTGFSSISSGIGSIASGISDQGYGTLGSRNGQSISRSGSRRDDESRRERSRRLLDRIIISDVPAGELMKLKMSRLKKKDELDNAESDIFHSPMAPENELLNFDVIAVDVKANGSPFSSTAAVFVDEKVGRAVSEELRSNFHPNRCGVVTEVEPNVVFVCEEPPQGCTGSLNESMSSTNDVNLDLLRNVRSGLCKSIEEWKKMSTSRDSSSTLLIYPMFCQCEAEWDNKATIDAIFLMLDGIFMNAKRWRQNGKCILAGLTPKNVQLLREKYDEIKQSVDDSEAIGALCSMDSMDTHSISSNSTVFGTNI